MSLLPEEPEANSGLSTNERKLLDVWRCASDVVISAAIGGLTIDEVMQKFGRTEDIGAINERHIAASVICRICDVKLIMLADPNTKVVNGLVRPDIVAELCIEDETPLI